VLLLIVPLGLTGLHPVLVPLRPFGTNSTGLCLVVVTLRPFGAVTTG